MTFASTTTLLRHAQARVLLVGSGRMGHIRAKAIYSNPRFEFCGIVDANVDEAAKLGEIYRVRYEWLLWKRRHAIICPLHFPLCAIFS